MVKYNKKVYIYAGLTAVVLVLGVLGIYFLVSLGLGHGTNSPATSIPNGQSTQKPEESDHTESISQTSMAGPYTEIAFLPSAVCTKPLTVKNAVGSEIVQDSTPKIEPGSGFYHGKVTPLVCYRAEWSPGNSDGFAGKDEETSLVKFKRTLDAAIPELPEKKNYLSSIQDTRQTMSLLNVYELSKKNVDVSILGYDLEILNEVGRKCYHTCKNPSFQSQCGDMYITSYSEGALLTMSTIIKFNSADVKDALNKEAGGKLSIKNAATVIKNAIEKSKISGSITIQALQIGGEPSRLAQVLNRDSAGYYASTWNLTEIDCCIKAVNSFLNYTKKDFPKQYSFPSRKGIVSLGVGFTKRQTIDLFGLKPPASPNF